MQVNEQETTSPQKPTICSPSTKAAVTPSTEAESPDAESPDLVTSQKLEAVACPDSFATPEREVEPSWVSSAFTAGAEAVSWVAQSLSAETPTEEAPKLEAEACQDSSATPECEAEPSWVVSALPQIGVATEGAEAVSWVAEAVSAETPTKEDLVWMCYLPKLKSEVAMAPPSWVADALAAEAMDAEYDLAVMSEFPKVTQPPWLFHTMSSKVTQPSWLQRSPKCDPATRAAAYSRLAGEGNEDESDEEDNLRQAAFSKLAEQCAIAAARNVAQEVNKAKWRKMLTWADDIALELLADLEPPKTTAAISRTSI